MTITPSTATSTAKLGLASIPATDGEAGRGELNNAATWDDFPNGRFGDFKSPAFGDTDPWGGHGIGVCLHSIIHIFSLIRVESAEQRSLAAMGQPHIARRFNQGLPRPSAFQNSNDTLFAWSTVRRIPDDPPISRKAD